MYKLIFIILFFFFCNSCEQPIDINLPNESPKLVISSSLVANKNLSGIKEYVYVSHSNLFGAIHEGFYQDSTHFINDAVVNIYQMENETQIAQEYLLDFNPDCYCYTHPNFIPLENKNYQLNISANNFPEVNALETMPSEKNFNISGFEMNNVLKQTIETKLCSFNITFEDDPGIDNFYKLRVVAISTLDKEEVSCSYIATDPSFFNPINSILSGSNYYQGKNGYFSDVLFDGQIKTFSVDVEKPHGAYDFFYIELTSFSKGTYIFNLTRKEQNRDNNNVIFNNEPIFIQSNIEGGYGVFGLKAITKKAYLPESKDWVSY